MEPLGFFTKEAWTKGSLDLGGKQKGVETALAARTQAPTEATADQIKSAQSSFSAESAKATVSKHYSNLTTEHGISKPVAAVRAGALGVNNATRRAALLAHANPAIATTLGLGTVIGGGTIAYKEGENKVNSKLAKAVTMQG